MPQMHKKMTNLEVAKLLESVAAVYQIEHEREKRFEIMAYREAADSIEHLSTEVKDIWEEGRLEEIPGVGEKLAQYLDQVFREGKSTHFEKILKEVPETMFPLLDVEGIGPKYAYKFATTFKLDKKNPIASLEKLGKEGRIAELEGFGEKSEEAILEAIADFKGESQRFPLYYAQERADEILEYMKQNKNVEKIEVLGSLRRKETTIGDVDIAVATNKPVDVVNHFVDYPKVGRVTGQGPRKASISLPGELKSDLRVQEPESFGALVQYFTGSKAHNIALRELAQKKGWSLSEYGIKKEGKLVAYATEEEFYHDLGMEWIPPELRQNSGEIEAALKGELPKLVEIDEVNGDLQIHSDFDIETSHDLGEMSMERIVELANEMGYEYVAMTEHNPAQKGHSTSDIVEILKRKADAVAKINEGLDKNKSMKKVFNSLEIDMLPEGGLPVPDKGLETLDFALVSIHSSFRQNRKDVTARILRALEHPKVKILAHPTGRKVMEREGVDADWAQVFEYCKKHDKWLEINCDPRRMDLPDELVRDAIDMGVKLSLGTDTHHEGGLRNMRYGVYLARRGWAEAKDIVNTRSLEEMLKLI